MEATIPVDVLSSPYTWIAIAISGLYLLYKYVTASFSYFAEQGIPGPKPIPIFGNLWGIWKMNMPINDVTLMKKYGKVMGHFDGSKPNLWTTDADLIRSVFVKDSDHFTNRRDADFTSKVIRKMLFIVRDQEWEDIRSALTPAFTTDKMSVAVEECAQKLAEKFCDIAKNDGKIDAKSQFGAFTIDVIARCAFGMKIDDLGSENDPFTKNAKSAFSLPANKTPMVLIPFVLPIFIKLVGEKMFVKSFKFFIDILEKLTKDRQKSPDKHRDFVETATEALMECKKEVNGEMVPMWTKQEVDEIVIAQSTVFLVSGYDTTATTLANTVFLLARNPEIQEKLHQEISTKLKENEGNKVSQEMIMDLPYLDQVIHEVLRMFPPFPRVERQCNKDVTYGKIKITKGTIVTVPTFALHYDEDYYPDPANFDPERWAPENKDNLNPYTWMPFGMGPRNCVGMRFALQEIKIALSTLISQVHFYPVPETPDEIKFEDGFLQIMQPIPTLIGLEMRS